MGKSKQGSSLKTPQVFAYRNNGLKGFIYCKRIHAIQSVSNITANQFSPGLSTISAQ
jgi:hypothetical protein